jgi:hypothetical protein
MKIELKKIAIYPRLSDETTAFNADVWIDGQKVGSAENDGHGGATIVRLTVSHARQNEIEAAFKAKVPAEYARFTSGVEWAVDEIVETQRVAKSVAKNDASFKRTCAKHGTSAARFDVPGTLVKKRIWIEYDRNDEASAKAQMLKKHPALVNWTVLA